MRWILALLAALGIVVSSLALHVHNTMTTEPCDINAHWDCGVVNHSHFAVLHLAGQSIPVAIIGIAGYTVLLLLALLQRWGIAFMAAVAGCLFALYLTWIEAHVLQVWCLYCVISQALIAFIVLLSMVMTLRRPQRI
jgi:vitamin-K-epoxide reductase (warfarin-sensitive)